MDRILWRTVEKEEMRPEDSFRGLGRKIQRKMEQDSVVIS